MIRLSALIGKVTSTLLLCVMLYWAQHVKAEEESILDSNTLVLDSETMYGVWQRNKAHLIDKNFKNAVLLDLNTAVQ